MINSMTGYGSAAGNSGKAVSYFIGHIVLFPEQAAGLIRCLRRNTHISGLHIVPCRSCREPP